VTDFDADEKIQPIRRTERTRYSTSDKVTVGAGVLLAAGAAFFPWYVFLNPGKFSVPALWQGRTRDLPETAPREVMSVSPMAMIDNDKDPPLESVDPVATATTPGLGKADSVAGLLHADLLGGLGLDDAACHFGFGEVAGLRRRHTDARGFEHRLEGGHVLRLEPGGIGVGDVACNHALAD
jgi:hypothetical protein